MTNKYTRDLSVREAIERLHAAMAKVAMGDTSAIKALAKKYQGRPVDVLLNNAGVLGDMKAQALGSPLSETRRKQLEAGLQGSGGKH